ncbi:hypothetical protein LMG31841_02625 [Paraburkholderia saeva]|uniref:Uncharacterized protein n=2 Tax=Paraburkholderia saeva TaxID=2777537 RepID=A0A9N8RXD6_9BURK|nr:hypothetical protein R70241_01442 [Paraburkholderia saeva]CAG4898478.1 hypothetical protein LMG31841_02625 [Paraburkholderia saeva]
MMRRMPVVLRTANSRLRKVNRHVTRCYDDSVAEGILRCLPRVFLAIAASDFLQVGSVLSATEYARRLRGARCSTDVVLDKRIAPVMKPAVVDMLRAHLLTASLAAMCLQLIALVSLLFDVSEAALESVPFRLLATGCVVTSVLLTRHVASMSFSRALHSRHATYRAASAQGGVVSVASNCPLRKLVILHLRMNGRPFELLQRDACCATAHSSSFRH